jgi:hypothetical protein
MEPIRWLVATLLLTAPPGTDLPDAAKLHAALAGSIRALAIEWQVLDPLETHILAEPKDFAADLKILQARVAEFSAAPRLDECRRLPELALVEDMLAFNRALQKDLKDRLALDLLHAADLQAALQETERLFHIWDTIRDARREYYYVTARRQALQRLRDLIGLDAFYSGQLPPHVPLWRLAEY